MYTNGDFGIPKPLRYCGFIRSDSSEKLLSERRALIPMIAADYQIFRAKCGENLTKLDVRNLVKLSIRLKYSIIW